MNTNPLIAIIQAAATTLSTAWSIIDSSPERRKFISMAITLNLAMFVAATGIILITLFVKQFTGYGLTERQRRRRSERNAEGGDYGLTDLGLSIMTGGSGIVAALGAAGSAFLGYMSSAIPIVISLVAFGSLGFLAATFSSTVMSVLWSGWVNFFNPVNYIFTTFLTAGAMLFVSAQPIVANVARFISAAPVRVGIVALQCIFVELPIFLYGIAQLLWQFALAMVTWVQLGILSNEIPLLTFFTQLGTTIGQFMVWIVECNCQALYYVTGGIARSFYDPNFGQFFSNAINIGYSVATRGILLPILSLFQSVRVWPSFWRAFELWNSALNNAGGFVQAAIPIQLDIYIYGGNGTFLEQVNGTLPMPTGWQGYLVRFCQANWAQGALRFLLNFYPIPMQVAWQSLLLVENGPIIPLRNGSQAFTFTATFEQLLFIADSAGSIVNTLGNCTNSPQFPGQYPFGNAVSSGAKAVINMAQMIVDVVFGEIYTVIFDQVAPGQYLEMFLLTQPQVMRDYDTNVALFANTTGCIIGYLDRYTGLAFEGLAPAVLIYFLRIPFQFVAYVRGILAGESPNVLDSVSIAPLEAALLQTSLVGQTVFQFDPTANDATCPTRVSFFCALGLALQRTLSVLFRIVIVILESFRIIIKSISSINTATGALSQLHLPADIACIPELNNPIHWVYGGNCKTPLVEDAYDAACRLGVALGTMFPFDVPCMTETARFCHVREFPNQMTQTYAICTGTFLCKVFRIPIGILDFFVTLLNWTQGMDNLDTDIAVTIVKKLISFIVFGVLSPICPLAHVLDCLFSCIAYGGHSGHQPASDLLCLITALITAILIEVGEFLVSLIQVVVAVIAAFFQLGGGDATANLLNAIIKFIEVTGAVLYKLVIAILQLALSFLFKAIVAICRVVNLISFNALGDSCDNLESSLAVLLGGLGEPLTSDRFENYKKRDTTNVKLERCAVVSSSNFMKMMDEIERSGGIKSRTREQEAECAPDEQSEFSFSKQTASASASSSRRGLGGTSLNEMDRVLEEIFGLGVTDPQDIPSHMATKVYWESSSSCYAFFKMMPNNTKLADLGPADKTLMYECIRLKAIAGVIARTQPELRWLPEDAFYNPWNAFMVLFLKGIRLALAVFQWLADRFVPVEMIFTKSYQTTWQTMWLNVDFYNGTLLPIKRLYPHNSTEGDAAVKRAIYNMTVTSYLKRNFPSLYEPSSSGSGNTTTSSFKENDPLFDPLRSFFDFTSEFSREAVQGVSLEERHSFTIKPSQSYNFTLDMFTDTLYSPEGISYIRERIRVHYQSHTYDYNNRTHLLEELGPDVVRAMDSWYSTKNMYSTVAGFLESIVDTIDSYTRNATGLSDNHSLLKRIQNRRRAYVQEAIRSGHRRSAEEFDNDAQDYEMGLVDAVTNVWQNTTETWNKRESFWQGVRKSITERLDSLYQSPAFKTNYTYLGAAIASVGSAAQQWMQAEHPKTLPPWCVYKASKILKLSFDEVREQVPLSDCDFYHQLSMDPNYDHLYDYDDDSKPLVKEDGTSQFDWKTRFEDEHGNEIDPEEVEEEEEATLLGKPSTKKRAIRALQIEYQQKLARGEPIIQKTAWQELTEPRNAQAIANREVFWRIPMSVIDEIWSHAYVVIGKDGTAQERFARTLMGVHPSFTEYWRENDPYPTIMAMLPQHRQEEIRRTGFVKFTDTDVHEAAQRYASQSFWADLAQKIKEAAAVRQAFQVEKDLRASRFYKNMMEVRGVQNEYLQVHAKQGRDATRYKYASAEHPILFTDQEFLNFTDILTRECHTTQAWLCEYCYVVDALVGRALQQYNNLAYYYTNDYPYIISNMSDALHYYTDLQNSSLTTPVRIGLNRTSQPRWPNLYEPAGYALQFSPSEVEEGLNIFAWAEQAIGGELPYLVPNGTCYNNIVSFNVSSQSANPASNIFWGFIRYIQVEAHIDICGVIDTAEFLLTTRLTNVFNWIVSHVFICAYSDDITCAARNYSLSGGLVVYAVYTLVGFLITAIVFQVVGSVAAMVFGITTITSGFFFFLIITYNWCFLCFPILPQCFVEDVYNLWAFTLAAPCNIFIGMFVSTPEYTPYNCADPNASFEFADCSALGFTNLFNYLAFAKVAFGNDIALLNNATSILQSFYITLMGEPASTFDYSSYNTDPIMHANGMGCFALGTVPYLSFALVLVIVGSALALAAVGVIFPLILNLVLALYGYLKFLRTATRGGV